MGPRVALIVLALTAPAAAQSGGATASSIEGSAASRTGPAQSDSADRRAMERVEAHIRDLHARLAITPAQEQQWAAFAGAMRQNAQAMERSHHDQTASSTGLPAIDALRSYAALSRLHADNVERLLPAFEALYQAMTADQRVSADRTLEQFQRAARGSRL